MFLLSILIFTCGLVSITFQQIIDVQEIIAECQFELSINSTLETKYAKPPDMDKTTPSLDGFQNKALLKLAFERSERQRIFECIAEKAKIYDMSSNSVSRGSIENDPAFQIIQQSCLLQDIDPLCDPSYPYRSIDGSCNNLQNPKWGSVDDCTKRFLPFFYEGVKGLRQSVAGGPLPNPRLLTGLKGNRPSHNFTTLFTFFGQFLDHDMADTPINSIDGVRLIECCPIMEDHHPECIPFRISPSDEFYSNFGVTCFPVTRSAPCPTCTLDKRSQMSQIPAFVDASTVYGAIEGDAVNLRAFDGTGMLRKQVSTQSGKDSKCDFLPVNFDVAPDKCGTPPQYCFKAGDRRANLHTPLMSIHTMGFREHNRIAVQLKEMNPGWDDEKLYQESRKIVGAMVQNIVYGEFLPPLLGQDIMQTYGLNVLSNGRSFYNEYLDPTIRTEFNTVAFRLHSLINTQVTDFEAEDGKFLLRNESFDASPVYHGRISSLVTGMAKTPGQMFDRNVVDDLTDFLYKERKGDYGFDLIAVNVQRGRDHGVAPYIYLAERFSGLNLVIRDFSDLLPLISQENIDLLKQRYNNVADIDPWIGLNYERVTEPMVLGNTAANIIAEQFRRLKYGDRFFFEHAPVFPQPPYFTDSQLAEIRKSSLARIICDNTDATMIQRRALLLPDLNNPILPCDEIQEIDLSPWKEAEDIVESFFSKIPEIDLLPGEETRGSEKLLF